MAPHHPPPSGEFGFPFVPLIAAAILLAGGALNAYEIATGPIAEPLWVPRWVLITVVEVELVLGLWLLSGFQARWARWVTLASFACFLAVSLYQALTGAASCGCFGKVEVNPWYTVGLDAALILVLWAWRPASTPAGSLLARRLRLSLTALFLLVVPLSAGWAMARHDAGRITPEGEFAGDDHFVVLEPETWTGKRFPLLGHTDLGDQLAEGRWLVLLYHRNCSVCRQEISHCEGMARANSGQPNAVRIALLEVPEDGAPAEDPVSQGSPCSRGRLDSEREWFVRTPVVVHLEDGRATAVVADPHQLAGGQISSSDRGPGNELSQTPAGASSTGQQEEVSPGWSARGFPDYREARRRRFLSETACGPLALLAVLKHLELPLPEGEANRIMAAAGPDGTDLGQLQEEAEKHALHALGVEVSLARLKKLGLPAIVHLHGKSFAAAIGFPPGGVRLIYPLEQPTVVPDAAFEKAFGSPGRALLVSKEPLSAPQLGLASASERTGPGLALRPVKSMIPLGRLRVQEWDAALALYNAGSTTLHIKTVEPSCTCMTAAVDRDTLRPGESATLRVKGKQNTPGPFTYAIALSTDQPGQPFLRLPIHGYLDAPVSPEVPAVILENVAQDHEAAARVPLTLAQGVALADLEADTTPAGPLTAEVKCRADGKPDLALRWHGAAEPGWYRYEMHLRDRAWTGGVSASLFVAVQVLPSVGIFPPSLLVSDEELAGPWRRSLTITGREALPMSWTVVWADSRFAQAVRVVGVRAGDGSLSLALSPARPDAVQSLLGESSDLVVRFPGRPRATTRLYIGKDSFVRANALGSPGKQD